MRIFLLFCFILLAFVFGKRKLWIPLAVSCAVLLVLFLFLMKPAVMVDTPKKLRNPKIWGNGTWKLLHCMSHQYSPEKRSEYRNFYKSLVEVLPCGYCRDHSKEFFASNPIEQGLSSREDMIRYVIDWHNSANHHAGNPFLPFRQALQKVQSYCFGKI